MSTCTQKKKSFTNFFKFAKILQLHADERFSEWECVGSFFLLILLLLLLVSNSVIRSGMNMCHTPNRFLFCSHKLYQLPNCCRNWMLRIKLNKLLAIKLLLSNVHKRQWPQMVTETVIVKNVRLLYVEEQFAKCIKWKHLFLSAVILQFSKHMQTDNHSHRWKRHKLMLLYLSLALSFSRSLSLSQLVRSNLL